MVPAQRANCSLRRQATRAQIRLKARLRSGFEVWIKVVVWRYGSINPPAGFRGDLRAVGQVEPHAWTPSSRDTGCPRCLFKAHPCRVPYSGPLGRRLFSALKCLKETEAQVPAPESRPPQTTPRAFQLFNPSLLTSLPCDLKVSYEWPPEPKPETLKRMSSTFLDAVT